jgi:acyl-CoA thioesterase YciA
MELLNTHPIKKSDLGFHGNLFGGKLLAWLDASAAAFASQCCDTPRMVTVAIDKCIFKKPAKEGQLLKIYGQVKQINNSSIELELEARSHNVYNGKQHIILSTNITFVRIDEQGEPIPISAKVKNKYDTKDLNHHCKNFGE